MEKKKNSVPWASDIGVTMKVFLAIVAFFGGVKLSAASGEKRQRGAETVLEDNWNHDQVRT